MQFSQNIERGEYWLLDSVVEASLSLSALVVENIEETFNREGHGLGISDLINTLYRLFQREYLIAYYRPSVDMLNLAVEEFLPTKEEIRAGLVGDLSFIFCYRLTAQGGMLWESLSMPNWNLYISPFCSEEMEEEINCIEAGSRQILDDFLAFELAHPFKTVDHESIGFKTIEPWEATYWKTLPTGYQLTYWVQDIPYDTQESLIKSCAFDSIFFRWKRQNKWYSRYF
jgi:hypothetical protein